MGLAQRYQQKHLSGNIENRFPDISQKCKSINIYKYFDTYENYPHKKNSLNSIKRIKVFIFMEKMIFFIKSFSCLPFSFHNNLKEKSFLIKIINKKYSYRPYNDSRYAPTNQNHSINECFFYKFEQYHSVCTITAEGFCKERFKTTALYQKWRSFIDRHGGLLYASLRQGRLPPASLIPAVAGRPSLPLFPFLDSSKIKIVLCKDGKWYSSILPPFFITIMTAFLCKNAITSKSCKL